MNEDIITSFVGSAQEQRERMLQRSPRTSSFLDTTAKRIATGPTASPRPNYRKAAQSEQEIYRKASILAEYRRDRLNDGEARL